MTLSSLVNPSILSQPVYEPGKPIEDVARELGLDPAGIIKLASNENPLGASPLGVAAAGGGGEGAGQLREGRDVGRGGSAAAANDLHA
jgi:hypothetical protein